jgi:tetratricopeptide (TPR) repeat protein
MLALHFTRGKDSERGYRYHHLAGNRAAMSYANREAMDHFREAWDLIAKGDKDREEREKQLDTAIKLAEVMEPLGEFEPTLDLLEEVLNGSTGLEDPSRYDRIHYWMGNTFGNLGRYDDARKHLFRSLELSQESGNKETEGDAHNYLCQLDYVQGHFRRALDHAEASVQCLREIVNPGRLAWTLVTRGLALCILNREDDYKESLAEASAWIERCGNDRARCYLFLVNSRNFIDTGQYEAALKTALEGLELTEKIGEGILMVFLLADAGRAALLAGKVDSAIELFQRGELEGKKVGHPLGLTNIRLGLAKALLRKGRIEEAMEPAELALHFCRELDLGLFLQNALEINAEILSHRDPLEMTRIDEMKKQAAALVERGDSPWQRIQHLMAWSRISLKRGKIEVARENLSAARSLYREMGLEDGTGELLTLEEKLKDAGA